jgi:hypothetical protein
MEKNRITSRIIEDSRIVHDGQLGKGVIWVLQQFNNVTKKEISNLIGWGLQSVSDEINRLKRSSLGCLLLIKNNNNNDDNSLTNTYNFNSLGKKADLDLLTFLARENFKRSEQIMKDVRKVISHI